MTDIELGLKIYRLQELRKLKGSKSLYNFCQVYLRHHFSLPLCSFHTDLFHDLSGASPNRRMVRIAPRGHGKTTIACLAYPLWSICYAKKRSIVVIGSSAEMAASKMQDIITEIENNELLMKDFPFLKPKRDKKGHFVKYSDTEVVFDNGTKITCKGLGSAIRGIKPRPDLIILDDPDKDDELDSQTCRERRKRYFDSVVRFLGGPGATLDIIAIDTLKHFDSLINYIYKKPGWNGRTYKAIQESESGSQSALWESVYCMSVDDLTDQERTNFHLRGDPSLGYRIRLPFYGSMQINDNHIVGLAEENPQAFAQEFLAIPILLESMPLRKDNWKFYDYTDDLLKILPKRIAALDISMGKKHSDYQAIAVVGNKGKDYYLLDGSLTRYDLVKEGTGDISLARLVMLFVKQYKLTTVIVEDNGAQALFGNTLARVFRDNNILCKILLKKSKGDKYERINGTLGLIAQRGSFYVRNDYLNIYNDFMKQFEYYPKADHDDAPDSTNMAIMGLIQGGKSA